jgi:threonine synthase
MGHPIGLRCIRCGAEYQQEARASGGGSRAERSGSLVAEGADRTMLPRLFKGCPACLAQGHPANVVVEYDLASVRRSLDPKRLDGRPLSMWRYHELLPVDPEQAVTLGEGMTPLVRVPTLARKLGLRELYVKNETQNPTWSFKDRLASAAVSAARGLNMRVITGSSSGNAGAATAAYAARAGLPCVMFSTQQFPLAMKVQMAIYGTKLVAVPTIQDRWRMVEACVDQLGWFPVTVFVYPLVGSSPYGIDGYKTMAFEIVEQLGRVPDDVVYPVGAGDAFSGGWQGFLLWRKLGYAENLPRMVAAEVFGPLQHALDENLDQVEEVPWGPTVGISVGLNTSALQGLNVLRESDGLAARASDEEMMAMQRDLAASEGIYAEASSVLSLAVVKRLVDEGRLDPDRTVVAVLTSSGLKDPETTQRHLPDIQVAEPTLEGLARFLQDVYGFAIG